VQYNVGSFSGLCCGVSAAGWNLGGNRRDYIEEELFPASAASVAAFLSFSYLIRSWKKKKLSKPPACSLPWPISEFIVGVQI
jgi:hypothetical protein